MNNDQFSGQWKELKGKVKETWGELTDDEISRVDGKRDQLLGLLQQKYGYEREHAENELSEWEEMHIHAQEDTIYPDIHNTESERKIRQ